jgi:hypothetical protein
MKSALGDLTDSSNRARGFAYVPRRFLWLHMFVLDMNQPIRVQSYGLQE